MAFDPSIIMGYKGIGELSNPMNQLAQVSQIQNAQNQNALAQYQLSAAQRAEQGQAAIGQAYGKFYTDQPTGGAGQPAGQPSFGQMRQQIVQQLSTSAPHLIPGELAKIAAMEKEALQTKKLQGEIDLQSPELQTRLSDLQNKVSKQFKDKLVNVNNYDSAVGWLKSQYTNPVLAPIVSQEPFESAVQQIPKDPTAFADWKNKNALGIDEYIKQNKPHYITENLGGTSKVSALPGLGGAPSVISTTKKTMTPGEAEANAIARAKLAQDATGVVYQEDSQGNVIALPSKLKAGEVPTARVAVAPSGGFQPLQAKPSEAVGKEQMSINQQKAIIQGAMKAISETPDAFGYTVGLMPESVRGRVASPEENTNRSYLFNVVSGVIKERAGTAQSAAEAQTLARFLPTETDNADIIKSKLEGFDKYLSDKESGTTKKRGGPVKTQLAPVDQQALQWANSNPGDPRSAAIKQRLGQ